MVDFILSIILILFFIKGFFVGDSRELIGLFAMVLSCLVSYYPAEGIIRDLESAGYPREIGRIIGYGISAFFAFPFIYLLIDFVTRGLQYFGHRLNLAKRLIGGGFGLLKGLVLLVLLTTLLAHLPIKSKMLDQSFMAKSFRLY